MNMDGLSINDQDQSGTMIGEQPDVNGGTDDNV